MQVIPHQQECIEGTCPLSAPPSSDSLATRWTTTFFLNSQLAQMIDSGLVGPREQKMLKGHLPRVIYHEVY